MKKLLLLIIALVSFSTADAQITKKVKKFFKYSTIYGVAGEAQPQTSTLKTYQLFFQVLLKLFSDF